MKSFNKNILAVSITLILNSAANLAWAAEVDNGSAAASETSTATIDNSDNSNNLDVGGVADSGNNSSDNTNNSDN
ncbi:MAG TPA: dentin sialophosphoprotein, partial [Colwellia sp.]|nr:dentin sialophosphoprotein [Colwellia sp.]